MHIFSEIGPMMAYLMHHRSSHSTIGFVPTMGALHAGHISLIEASKKQDTVTVCSIYVNPTQFNNAADLAKYPRTQALDAEMLEDASCDAVFCPADSIMYPTASKVKFDFGSWDKILEGEFRPGHYSGVALIVAKLFNIIQPTHAYFGQKDFQQFKIISRLVEELKFDLSLVCIPTMREADGLAMSSRNIRLDKTERERATVLYQCLKDTSEGLRNGRPFSELRQQASQECIRREVSMEYLALADSENFELLDTVVNPNRTVLLMAARVGDVRLIDNMFLTE